jgi:hypothetical protein
VSGRNFDQISEEIQLVTGSRNGLGSLDYEMVTVEPVADESLWRFPDLRTMREKFGRLYAKEDPFPRDRHGGKGYLREDEVDLDAVAGLE